MSAGSVGLDPVQKRTSFGTLLALVCRGCNHMAEVTFSATIFD